MEINNFHYFSAPSSRRFKFAPLYAVLKNLSNFIPLTREATFTLTINQQMNYIKFHIKTLKIAPTCFDPKIILRELRCSLLKSF